jgi:hypothetical protein
MANVIENALLLNKAIVVPIVLLLISNNSGYILNKLSNRSPLKLC